MATKDDSYRRALSLIGESYGGLTRPELGRRLGVTRPTLTSLVAELEKRGWLEAAKESEHHRQVSSNGADVFQFTDAAGFIAAIHGGHRTLRVAILDSNGVIRGEPDPKHGSDVDGAGVATLGDAADLVVKGMELASVSPEQLRGVAFGFPGPVDTREGTLIDWEFAQSWTLVDIPGELRKALSRRFGTNRLDPKLPAYVENEATMMARGALATGLAGDATNFMVLKLSSGIGAGLVINQAVYAGSTGAATEFGHLPLASASPTECPRCGRAGCLETVASGEAIVRALKHSGEPYPSDLTIDAVIKAATTDQGNHPNCIRAIVTAGAQIGAVLADVATFLQLDRVIVAGILSTAGDLLLDPMKTTVAKRGLRFTQPKITGTTVRERQTLGLHGAAALVIEKTVPLVLAERALADAA